MLPSVPRYRRRIVLITRQLDSDALGVAKSVVLYLPADYDAKTLRYPVFYYLHGYSGDETTWVKEGKLDAAADALGLDAIIVMPDGDDSFFADEYETYISRDLITWVDSTFRTIATRGGRAIAGMSMGGYGALHLAIRHPDLYGACVAHSPVTAMAEHRPEWKPYDPIDLAATLVPPGPALYLDCGTEDSLAPSVQALHDVLVRRGIAHDFHLVPGQHDYAFAIERGPVSLAFLRAHTTPPAGR